jgi:hypothetical protein
MSFLGSILPAAIGGITSLFGADAASDAASAQAELAKKQWKQARQDFKPYYQAGTAALDPVMAAYGLGDDVEARRASLESGFESSPLYKYVYEPALETSINNYNRFASSTGALNSGGTLKALQDRAGQLGGATFGNYLDGLTGLKNQGQASAAAMAGATAPGFAAQGAALGAQGDASTAGILGFGNALTGGLNNLAFMQGQSSYGSSPITTAINPYGTGGLY